MSMLAFAMPTQFTRAQVEAIAALAHLELDSSEVELFVRQLGDFLAYADQVQQMATAGVPPMAHAVTRRGPDRPDEVVRSLEVDDALANAPDAASRAGFFRVPRVIG